MNDQKILKCIFRLGSVIAIFLLTGCQWTGIVRPSDGKYQGVYDGHDVVAQVQVQNNTRLIITVAPAENKLEGPSVPLGQKVVFTVKLHFSGNIDIRSDSKNFAHFKFKPSSASCFASIKSASKVDSTLELCWAGDRIHVFGRLSQSQYFELNLTLIRSEEMPILEIPTKFKISELIERAKTHNFESIVEFQKVLIAKSQAQVAYMNLFPHGNLNDVLGLLTLNYLAVLRTIGDLAPFLLPSRWARAAEAKDLLIAEKQAWVIMDLDGMNITESLAHSARRDSEALLRLQAQKGSIEGIRDLVRIKEAAGLLQLGSSDDLTSLMNQVEVTTVQLEGVQRKELAALSHAAGFYNPRAIMAVEAEDTSATEPRDSVQSPIQLDLNNALQLAIVRSAELRQILAMVQWAREKRTERIFNWLDPASEMGSGLGPSFPFYLSVSFRKIDEMLARKEQLKSLIFRKVSESYTDLNVSIREYNLAIASEEIQARRVLRISQNLKIGITFVMSDLVAALQDQVRADLNRVNAEYGYLIALSRLNRLLYQGPYMEGLVEDKKDL